MVELKNVSFRYGSENAECMYASSLKNIDLTVKTGECVLLTGPSGCGKTTILRLINGLIPHFYPGELSGDIFIEGGSVKERELYDTALIIGTVFQNPRTQFYNVDTTGELAFGCENRGLPEQEIYTRIDRTVAHFRMASLMDRNIFRLSDGEKQKIACASINVSEPKIILLDEPSANLDYTATLMLRELILRWKAEGKTIIAAEHRIAYLWDIIDRAVVLRDGEIVGEFTGNGKEELTQNQLTQMGLRTTVMESPAEMQIGSFREGDRPITLRNFHFAYHGEKKTLWIFQYCKSLQGKLRQSWEQTAQARPASSIVYADWKNGVKVPWSMRENFTTANLERSFVLWLCRIPAISFLPKVYWMRCLSA